MRAPEKEMNDLHLSLNCGDSVEKLPSRNNSTSQEEDPSKQPSEDITSHTLYLSRQNLKDIPDYALKCSELKVWLQKDYDWTVFVTSLISLLT